MSQPAPMSPVVSAARWRLIRDGLVFPLKLLLGNLQNFVLLPLALVAFAIDLLFRGHEGADRQDWQRNSYFYRVLRWGRDTDEIINIYGAIGGYRPKIVAPEGATFEEGLTVDSLVARVEEVLIRECEKGGSAASVRTAVDRVLDEIQRRARRGKPPAPPL